MEGGSHLRWGPSLRKNTGWAQQAGHSREKVRPSRRTRPRCPYFPNALIGRREITHHRSQALSTPKKCPAPFSARHRRSPYARYTRARGVSPFAGWTRLDRDAECLERRMNTFEQSLETGRLREQQRRRDARARRQPGNSALETSGKVRRRRSERGNRRERHHVGPQTPRRWCIAGVWWGVRPYGTKFREKTRAGSAQRGSRTSVRMLCSPSWR